MTPESENAIRSVARRCRREIRHAIAGKPTSEHNPIITALLNQHAKLIIFMPPSFSAKQWLIYFIRKLEKERASLD